MDLYISRIISAITNLGPGKRIGLWVQGCSLRCEGCMSPDLAGREEKNRRDVEKVFKEIISLCQGHVGLTVTGGEPFEQPSSLAALLKKIRKHTNLDLLIYSGYTLKEIMQGSKAMRDLLKQADFLIDGRYRHELPTRKIWRGSSNQSMHILSQRVRAYKKYVDMEYFGARPLQLSMDPEHGLQIFGIPEPGFIEQLEAKMRNRGIILSHNLSLLQK